jgi:hypothetical protein
MIPNRTREISDKRAPDSIGAGLERSLASYVAAAGAAGLGLLASASVADAKIVYFPARQPIPPNSAFALDVNHDGVTDFNFTDTFGCNFDYCYGRLSVIPVAGNAVEGKLGFLGTRLASALNAGAQIGPAAQFSGQLMARTSMGSTGQWLNVTNRYLGLKFRINGQTHFGWARLTVQVRSARVSAALTGYAYETVPNMPILAGKTSGADDAATSSNLATPEYSRASAFLSRSVPDTPVPVSLGMLALGARGLPLWRRNSPGGTE